MLTCFRIGVFGWARQVAFLEVDVGIGCLTIIMVAAMPEKSHCVPRLWLPRGVWRRVLRSAALALCGSLIRWRLSWWESGHTENTFLPLWRAWLAFCMVRTHFKWCFYFYFPGKWELCFLWPASVTRRSGIPFTAEQLSLSGRLDHDRHGTPRRSCARS